jgi:hypothetical protein
MNQKQWNDFQNALRKTIRDHGFHSRSLKVQGQTTWEKKIQERKDKPYEFYHPETYGSTEIFDEFKRIGSLKLVWARMSSSVREYRLDPEKVAAISPDHCPVTGAIIDYGYGLNRVTDNPYFRPGIDHMIAVGNGGEKYGDISNIQIVSQFYNTIKNYGTFIDAIKWVNFELTK